MRLPQLSCLYKIQVRSQSPQSIILPNLRTNTQKTKPKKRYKNKKALHSERKKTKHSKTAETSVSFPQGLYHNPPPAPTSSNDVFSSSMHACIPPPVQEFHHCSGHRGEGFPLRSLENPLAYLCIPYAPPSFPNPIP